MAWGELAQGAGSFLAGLFGGGGERELTPEEIEILKRRLLTGKYSFNEMARMEPKMTGPIDMAQIKGGMPLISQAILPQLKNLMTSVGAKFGVRSPITTGTVGQWAGSTLAQGASNLYNQAIMDKWRKLSEVYQAKAGLARV